MNINVPCLYFRNPKGIIYVQSYYQCLTCKRVVDDCCGSKTVQCIVPINNDKLIQSKR